MEQHGEIPEGTTGEGHQGAASSLAADRAESWTGWCCETTPQNLSKGHCSQCCFLLQIIPHLELSSCLPHPGGNSQLLFFSLSLLHIWQSFFLGSLWWLWLPPPGSYLQVWVVPALAAPQCLSCSPWALPSPLGVFGVAGGNQATAAVLLRIMQRK